jgi:[ribosomal protein S5]-alanine N-acetyltransferase
MRLPPYKEFPELISDGIVLRQIQNHDIEGIIEISFYDGKPALTSKDAIEMQNRINMDYNSGSSIHWGIADRNTDEIIGTVGYYRGFDKETGELGFVLKPAFWGRSFMTMAMRLAVEFGIKQIDSQGQRILIERFA